MKWMVVSLSVLLFWMSGCAPREKREVGRYSLKDCKSGGKELKGVQVDRILVRKGAHKMYLYHKGKVIETMPVSLGKNASKGPKSKKVISKLPPVFTESSTRDVIQSSTERSISPIRMPKTVPERQNWESTREAI
jgi:hypothetical protein